VTGAYLEDYNLNGRTVESSNQEGEGSECVVKSDDGDVIAGSSSAEVMTPIAQDRGKKLIFAVE